ncbi:hypothetical protein QG37_04541 [Candidozyma auris]|uniref:Uncharacterized protein n=1 Tax=Candidozyma auris TaxID=498019 RepID=A0A0L0NY94_CANAR|nr:hypothetical protein QG37_04541 [[Candida] auris]
MNSPNENPEMGYPENPENPKGHKAACGTLKAA